ncbi:MAG: 50S ribosomal protein L25/general stress protein Ctc [Bacteroidales bacterium]|nr:50S ribosomal protein L25/general stress protein Ctc [Bacteroidales bacterium]
MKSIELKGTARTIAARSSEQSRALKAIRKNGEVPCVMYGGEKNYNFTMVEKDLNKIVYTPHIFVIDLIIDGEKKNAILKDIQFQPVKDTILHVDFYEIDESKPIIMNVPVELAGLAPGVQAGGKMQHQMRRLKVRALYTTIPEKLTIDVSKMGLGKAIKVGELSFEGLELINPKDAVVCSIKATRNSVDTTATTEDAEAPAAE